MEKLKIVLSGETINLCEPTLKFAGGNVWFKWINNPEMNRHLNKKYRKKKNTKKKQIRFFINHKKEKRKIFIISTKKHIYKGVVSLSKINKVEKSCDIALITDTKIEPLLAPYAGLEAIALMSNFAITKLKLKRIDCCFKIYQKNWLQRMELLGYKYYFRSKSNSKSFSSIMMDKKTGEKEIKFANYFASLNFKDFQLFKRKRGKLWDNLELMKKRISRLPKKSFWDIYDKFLDNDKKRYYNKIYKI